MDMLEQMNVALNYIEENLTDDIDLQKIARLAADSEWFPSSNYEQKEGPEILWNENKDLASPTFRSEIWIPVLKK